jgi:hypothetical protein
MKKGFIQLHLGQITRALITFQMPYVLIEFTFLSSHDAVLVIMANVEIHSDAWALSLRVLYAWFG